MITIFTPSPKAENSFLQEDIAAEDVEFVRACRGRLAQQLQATVK